MLVDYNKKFLKRAAKLQKKDARALVEAISLFEHNTHHPDLRNHPLKGTMKPRRSIDITHDLRALYIEIDDTTVLFTDIGTHSELYE
jgi:addiction module RelE/StbE family toxin